MAFLLRHHGRGIMAIGLVTAALGLVVLSRGDCSVFEARRRADLEVMQQFREASCSCQTTNCARRVAKLPAFSGSAMSAAAELARMDGWICLSRVSDSCTLADLRGP